VIQACHVSYNERIKTRKDTRMKAMDEEKSVLRWGGLAGILGGIIFILVFVIVIAFVGACPTRG
jgi:hypothetical protein